VPAETFPDERRVAMTPRVVEMLVKSGLQVLVESGAGYSAGFPNSEYEKYGARIATGRSQVFESSGAIIQVRTLGANPEAGRADLRLLSRGQTVIGFGEPLTAGSHYQELATSEVTSFALELMPRITRAQSMDALSSMATIAGYKAVLLAASALPRMFPLLMTAAGTIVSARVLVLGAGVAGLQAIATARRLGAVVSAYDVRPAVKEQVESLGAKFVSLALDTARAETSAGYASTADEAFYKRQRELLGEVVREHDIVITTAAVPGQKAPVLLTRPMVAGMPPGSVVLDLAAERGGNCELTQRGRTIVEDGVTIMGPVNVPSTVPYHASQMYARNITAFIKHLLRNDTLAIDLEDEITRETLVTHQGAIVHPRVRQLAEKEQPESDAIR
jgi:NAD(P) transhydrogenase subunit alpha